MNGYTTGQRVEIHPATDAWMQGDMYGEIIKIGTKYLHIKMDRSGRVLKYTSARIFKIITIGQ